MTYTQLKECIEEIGKEDLRELLNSFSEEIIEDALKQNELDELLKTYNDYDEDIVISAYNCNIQFSDIQECYQGQYRSDEDFAQQLLEDIGEIPSKLPGYIYIDWERTARDIMMDYSEDNGYYFRNI